MLMLLLISALLLWQTTFKDCRQFHCPKNMSESLNVAEGGWSGPTGGAFNISAHGQEVLPRTSAMVNDKVCWFVRSPSRLCSLYYYMQGPKKLTFGLQSLYFVAVRKIEPSGAILGLRRSTVQRSATNSPTCKRRRVVCS